MRRWTNGPGPAFTLLSLICLPTPQVNLTPKLDTSLAIQLLHITDIESFYTIITCGLVLLTCGVLLSD